MGATLTRWRRVASILLLLPSLLLTVYAPLLPVPVGPQVLVSVAGFGVNVATVLGLAGIVAAIGVWRARPSGRVLGAIAGGLLLVLRLWTPFQRLDIPSESVAALAWAMPALVLAVAYYGVILFALARRWP